MMDTRNTSSERGGFTLIELLVVISLIVILLGIGVVVAGQAFGKGAQRKTVLALAAARNAATEYQVVANQRVNHLNTGNPFKWNDTAQFPKDVNATVDGRSNPDGFAMVTIRRFVWAVEPVTSAQAHLTKLGEDRAVKDNKPGTEDRDKAYKSSRRIGNLNGQVPGYLTDAWGQPLAYSVDVVVNTTESGELKFDDHLPARKGVFFASPGADGKWGNANTAPNAEAKDNLYSFNFD